MIESVNNEKVKYFKRLRNKKNILEERKYIIEGEHLVEEAYKSGLLESLIVLDGFNIDIDVPKTYVSSKVLKSISLLNSVPKVMGIVRLVESNKIIGDKILLLDKVQDPGNVGTLIRSALAFNVKTVVLSPDSVSLYNDKMIRSSEGTIFNMNVVRMDLQEAINHIKTLGIKVYYADMDGQLNLDEESIKNYALVLGSEGEGISSRVKELSDESIYLPMNDKCESLNVAITGGIIMYKFR